MFCALIIEYFSNDLLYIIYRKNKTVLLIAHFVPITGSPQLRASRVDIEKPS